MISIYVTIIYLFFMPAADTSTDILIPNSRILYVDPNDIFGNINGVPMTPDYTDLCIAFDLQCEIVSRNQTEEILGVSKDGKYGISAVSGKKEGLSDNHWASLLRGEMTGKTDNVDDRSLTIYYTDINYDSLMRETVIEGLGVESIDVAYESYYTPNITIKFVDHRGAALFGREEAIHYNDKITIDNIFGAFFTIPYPKFKLQIKGFLGEAITYQLSCTSFKGSLNSQTGNFEAVATFIGYSYSLLTDIPFEYLVAAPYCEYFGKDYWEEHKGSEEWRMDESYEGDDVPTFYELFQKINAAFTKKELLDVISEEDQKRVDTADDEVTMLSSISEIYNNFLNSIEDIVGNPDARIRNYEPGHAVEEGQILYMSNDINLGEWSTPKAHWGYLMAAIEQYNNVFEDRKITEDILPTPPTFENVNFTPFFVKVSGSDDVKFKDIKSSKVEDLIKVRLNGNTINSSMATAIIDFINKAVSKAHTLPNVYLLNCGSLSYLLENRTAMLKTEVEEINDQKERNYIHLAINHLGIVPYIGNIFKLIMCHIETFVYMMLQCFNNIKTATKHGQRTAAFLGIYSHMTFDVNWQTGHNSIASTNIPPWPAVNRVKDEGDEYSIIESTDTYGWVGDFSPYFEEAKLVRALYLACKRTAKDPSLIDKEEAAVDILYLPIIPNDLNNNLNPFADGTKDISSMAGMVGLRAAQIFGIGETEKIDDDLATKIGKMDALNYYRFVGTKEELTAMFQQNSGNLADTLYNIMLCKPDADKYGTVDEGGTDTTHAFEFAKGIFADKLTQKNRHPIYEENGDSGELSYTYLFTKSHYGIVPANTLSRESYKTKYTIAGEENNKYFNFQLKSTGGNLVSDSFLHRCTSKQLLSDYGSENSNYINNEMYAIVTRPGLVKGIMNRYDEMQSGVVRVLGEKYKLDMGKVLDRYWIIGKKHRYDYMSRTLMFFAKDYKDYGIDEKSLFAANRGPDASLSPFDTYDKIVNVDRRCFFYNDGNIKDNDKKNVDINSLIIQQLFIADEDRFGDLFGSVFYYQQNEITDPVIRERVKALLFLRALPYNYDNIMYWDKEIIKHSSIVRLPIGFAALYGALLWRHNYIKQYGSDPIICGNYKKLYENNIEYDLARKFENGSWRLGVIPNGSSETYQCTIFKQSDSALCMFSREPDPIVANEMLRVFDEFINKQWRIISQLELTKNDGTTFTGSTFKAHVTDLITKFNDAFKSARQNVQDEANYRAALDTLLSTVDESEGGSEGTNTNENNGTATEQQDAPIDEAEVQKEQNRLITNSLIEAANSFKSFTINYCFLWYYFKGSDSSISLWLNTSNKKMQSALRSIYMDECIELRTSSWSYRLTNESTPGIFTDINVNSTNLKSYLSGFAEQLNKIVGYSNNDIGVGEEDEIVVEATKEFNRDAALPIYLYLKMLWDKWLVSIKMTDHPFMVKNFNKNFIFIDSFYRNIAHRFMLNCQTLLECYESNVTSNSDITVFKFIGDITTKHHCMFVAVPYFITNWAHESPKLAAEALKTIFTPIPFSQIPPPEENNKFVTIFVPKLSENPSELNNFRDDGFNIWSYNDYSRNDQSRNTQNETLPSVLCNIENFDWDSTGDLTRYGYYVPSFGLAYGRQNNHIFRNINLGMDTPIMTSAVINTLSHASRRGANNTHRIAYIGEDIYPVFSNYSYFCEFEMIGCAQMQPLMYFQLMNVPMWRGTYIVISVSHSMTPGNMVTKVKAMKLSNRAVPYSNAWFTENPNFDPEALRKTECLEDLVSGKLKYNVQATVTNIPTSDGEGGLGDFTGGGSIKIIDGKFVNDVDSKDIGTNVKKIYKMFVDAGATDQAARAILANIRAESGKGYNPRAFTWDGHMNPEKYTEKEMIDSQGPGGGLIGFKYPGGLRGLALANGWTVAQLDDLRAKIKSQIPYPIMKSSEEKSANQTYIREHIGDFPFTLEQQVKRLISLKGFQDVKSWTDPVKVSNYWEDEVERPDNPSHTRWQTHGSYVKQYLSS